MIPTSLFPSDGSKREEGKDIEAEIDLESDVVSCCSVTGMPI